MQNCYSFFFFFFFFFFLNKYTCKKIKILQVYILNYNLSIVYFRLIKIILGNMISIIQWFFYVNTTEIHQSIWQIAAILESGNVFYCYDVIGISCNKILL